MHRGRAVCSQDYLAPLSLSVAFVGVAVVRAGRTSMSLSPVSRGALDVLASMAELVVSGVSGVSNCARAADFSNLPDYSSADFNPSDPQMLHMQGSAFTPVPQVPSGPISNNGTSSPTGQSTRSTPITSQAPAGPAPARTAAPTPAPVAGTKRKRPPQHDGPLTPEEAARLAAEEDKRRRNTAASARFRIKKKLREQALERTVKETTEKNAALEARVSQLELENQWLKNLITEKNGGTSSEADKEEIAQLFKKFLATQQKAESERNASQSKQGVGTSA